MYVAHSSQKLQDLFAVKTYQGADPSTAQFLFFGLDANYDPSIEDKPYFSEIVSYLEDGVRYWKEMGFHHPFLHQDYRGDGKLYHRRFAEIGFKPEHAERVSFVELVDVPTCGRSTLQLRDLKSSHLTRLREWVRGGAATYIFMPPQVSRLLRRTQEFAWLFGTPTERDGTLPVLYRELAPRNWTGR